MSGNSFGKLFVTSPPSARATDRPSGASWTAVPRVWSSVRGGPAGGSRPAQARASPGTLPSGGSPTGCRSSPECSRARTTGYSNRPDRTATRISRSKDYSDIAAKFRPGHADYTYDHEVRACATIAEAAVPPPARPPSGWPPAASPRSVCATGSGMRVRGFLSRLGPIRFAELRLGSGGAAIPSSVRTQVPQCRELEAYMDSPAQGGATP